MNSYKVAEAEYTQNLKFTEKEIKSFIKELLKNKQNINDIILKGKIQIERIYNLINNLYNKENVSKKDINELKELKKFYEKFKHKIWNYIAIQRNILDLKNNAFGRIVNLELENKEKEYLSLSERFEGNFNIFINMNNIEDEISHIANELKMLYNLVKENNPYNLKNIKDPKNNAHIEYLKQLLKINEINLINYYNNLSDNNLNKKEVANEIKTIQTLIKNFNNKKVDEIYKEINKLTYIKSMNENIQTLIKNFNDIKANIELDKIDLELKEKEIQELEIKYFYNNLEQKTNQKYNRQIKLG